MIIWIWKNRHRVPLLFKEGLAVPLRSSAERRAGVVILESRERPSCYLIAVHCELRTVY